MNSDEQLTKVREEHRAFLYQLGRLTLAWADIEAILFKLLRRYSSVTWPIARALFSGTRARSAITFIRAIADNTDMRRERRKDLEEIFTQILAINSLRDFVVHHIDGSMTEYDDDLTKRFVSDSLRASRTTRVKTYLVSSATLATMTADCHECCWRLHSHLEENKEEFSPGSGRGERQAWAFKPPASTQRPERGW